MYILIWILFIALILILVAISEREIAKQDAEWMKEECEKARDRELAEVRLRRTSDFKPDFENGNGGWLVGYDHEDDRLRAVPIDYIDYGEPVRYATEEEAKRSISENREDWLAYLGIKED